MRFNGSAALWQAVSSWGTLEGGRTVVTFVRIKPGAQGVLFDGSTRLGSSPARLAEGRWQTAASAIECAWFIMHEGRQRGDQRIINLGTRILDCMWQRGWDAEHGGLLYFIDLHGKPVQE